MCSHQNCFIEAIQISSFIEAIQISTFNILYQNKIKKNHPILSEAAMEYFLLGTQERVQIAVVNIPTVFEPLKSTVFWLKVLIAHQWDLDFQNQTPICI